MHVFMWNFILDPSPQKYLLRKKIDKYDKVIDLASTKMAIEIRQELGSDVAYFESVIFNVNNNDYGQERVLSKFNPTDKNIVIEYGNSNNNYTVYCVKKDWTLSSW